MSPRPFEAHARSESGVAVIDLSGELNSSAEEALSRAYEQSAATGAPAIMLNFTGVGYINSTGIALIVGLLARARQSHRRLLVYGLTEHYREIFSITRLSDFMTIHPDEGSAFADIAGGPSTPNSRQVGPSRPG